MNWFSIRMLTIILYIASFAIAQEDQQKSSGIFLHTGMNSSLGSAPEFSLGEAYASFLSVGYYKNKHAIYTGFDICKYSYRRSNYDSAEDISFGFHIGYELKKKLTNHWFEFIPFAEYSFLKLDFTKETIAKGSFMGFLKYDETYLKYYSNSFSVGLTQLFHLNKKRSFSLFTKLGFNVNVYQENKRFTDYIYNQMSYVPSSSVVTDSKSWNVMIAPAVLIGCRVKLTQFK
jgi:hypothetical protein